MTLSQVMNAATLGKPKQLRPMILWTILEYAFRGAPYGILLMAVWVLFGPLQNPGTPLNTRALALIWTAFLVSLVLLLLISRKSYSHTYYGSYEIGAKGRLAIGEHLRRLSLGFFNTRDPGEVGSYLINDYANIENLLSHLLPQIFGAAAMPLVLLTGLAFMDLRLALAAAMVIPLALPAAWISGRIIVHFGRKHQRYRVRAASRMIEYLQGIKLIKAFNLRGTKFDRLEKTFRELKVMSIKQEGGVGPTMILAGFILHGGITVIILLGLTFLLAGEVTLPVYIMFLILGSRVYEPLLQALMFTGELRYFSLSVKRIEELRKTPPLQGDDKAAPQRYDVEFRNVTFRYYDAEVLKNVSITIPERALTAIVGPSGSGKTTMTRLIGRFWDLDQGTILLGGRDLRTYDPDDVLASLAMVFQDVYLFNDTIINNIRVGNRTATRFRVIEAAKKARCHDFIEALPGKYETLVGEGGSNLSGGEKQRISIARAILKDAPLILLDEATASLDPENELFIQEAINELVKNKTVVVIAHRLNTVVGADKIIVLDQGRVVEEGTHQSLMKQKDLYYRLWEEQKKTRSWRF